MPRRAVSPVTLETCSPSPSEIDPANDLLGSDDELDDEERTAKRQRIEKLAEAHLQGRPLFILSASLSGPFENGWKNPWKKNRRRKNATGPNLPARNFKQRNISESSEPIVVQETDPQPSRLKIPAISEPRSPVSLSAGRSTRWETRALVLDSASPTPARSSKKRPASVLPVARSENDRSISRSSFFANAKDDSLPAVENHTLDGPGSTTWLKRDGKRSNFYTASGFPSSPTPKGSRKIVDRDKIPNPSFKHSAKKARDSPIRAQDNSTLVDTPSVSPSKRGSHAVSSFNVVSSTSQLPRFEYRNHRRHVSSPGPKLTSYTAEKSRRIEEPSRLLLASISQVDEADKGDEHDRTNFGAAESPIKDVQMPDAGPQNNDQQPQQNAQVVQLSKSLRFATDTEGVPSTHAEPQPSTEQNSYAEIPSAQQVSGPLGVSDRMPSLHSTAVPKESIEKNQDTSPDTQLSTQAALMHAQRFFQDDLDSPLNELGVTPLGRRALTEIGNDSLLAQETPLFRPSTSDRVVPRSFKALDKDKVQALSTQGMIDAASPFTFSSEKKQRLYQAISPTKPSPSKIQPNKSSQVSDTSETAPPEPGPTSSLDNGDKTAQPDNASSQPHNSPSHYSEHFQTHKSVMQATPLPFALSGSTPTTVQDGQWAHQEAESFDVSQAIADAGSWLKQPFDF